MATSVAEDAETASYESSSSSSSDDTVLISKKHRKKLQLKQQQQHKDAVKDSKESVQKPVSSSSSVSSKSPVGASANKADHICGICEREGGDLFVCTGSCVSAYHVACLQLSSAPEEPRDQWKCPNCVKNTHVCFHCKQLGLASGDASADGATSSNGSSQDDPQLASLRAVVKCRALSCGKFYHQDCIATLPLARIAGSRFICPLHTCAACEQSGAKKEPVRCTRCPVAYHTSCLPRSGVHHLPGKRIICPKHEVVAPLSIANAEETTERVEKRDEAAAVDEATKIKKTPVLMDILNAEDARSLAASSPRTEENDDARSDASVTEASSSKKHSKKDKKDKKKKKKKRKKDKKKDKDRSVSSSHRSGGEEADNEQGDVESLGGSKEGKLKKEKPSVQAAEGRRSDVVDGNDDAGQAVRGEDVEEEKSRTGGTSSDNQPEQIIPEDPVLKAEDESAVQRAEPSESALASPAERVAEVPVHSTDDRELQSPASGRVKTEESSGASHVGEASSTEDPPTANPPESSRISVEHHELTEAESPIHTPPVSDGVSPAGSESRSKNPDDEPEQESPISDSVEAENPKEAVEGEAKSVPAATGDEGFEDGGYDSGNGSQSGKALHSSVGIRSAVEPMKDEKLSSSNRSKKSKKKKKGRNGDGAKRSGRGVDEQADDDGAGAPDEAKWVQCDECKKWRTVPKEIDLDAMPDTWYCTMNSWNKAFASCTVPEDAVETKKSKTNKRSNSLVAGEVASASSAKKAKLPKQSSAVADTAAPSTPSPENELDKDKPKAAKRSDKDSKKRKLKLKLKEKYGEVKWVQCESAQCGKWRVVPLSIDFDLLPSVWYCQLNTWAPELANCSAANPIEVEAYLSKSQSKKPSSGSGNRPVKRLKGAATAEPNSHDASTPTTAPVSASSAQGAAADVATKAGLKASNKGSTKSAAAAAPSTASAGRGASVSSSNNLIQRHPSAGIGGQGDRKIALEGVRSVVLEWAQCEKCNKWRKLPAHIKSSTLPDKWYCTMNHWDPSRASCATPQEEDQEPLIDASPLPSSQNWYPMPGQVGSGSSSTGAGAIRSKRGKLSYSELLYASTGQLRKTYTSESSTLSFEYEGITYHRDDMYKRSSMYVSPMTTNKLTGESIDLQSDVSKTSNSSTNAIQFVAPATQQLAERVAQLILRKMDLRRAFSITEIVDDVVSDIDTLDATSGTEGISLSVITTAMAQLTATGEIEKVAPPPRHEQQQAPRVNSASSSTTILLGSLSSQPAYYRKVPKRPLKAMKAWKLAASLAM